MGISVTIYTLGSSTHKGLLSFLPVTSFTRDFIVNTFDSKRPKIMVLSDVHSPAIRRMTPLTITDFISAMNINMTGFAILWHASILILHMAFTAFSVLMLTF